MLAQLDYVGGVVRALGQGPIPLPDITDFLTYDSTQQIWKDLNGPTRENALTSLLSERSPQVAAVLARCWKFLRRDVVQRMNDYLDLGDPGLAVWCLGALGSATSLEDRLLGDLLVPEGRIAKGARWDQRFSTLVELLRRRPVPAPGEYKYACDQLRFGDASEWQARLVRELLSRELAEASSADRARGWVGWLCRSPFVGNWARPDWVAAMDFIVQPATRQGELSMCAIVSRDALWTVALLRLGSHEGRLGELVAATSVALAQLAAAADRTGYDRHGPEVAAELRADLRVLGVRADTAAQIDAVLVLSDVEPQNFPVHPQDGQWARDYLAGLRAAFALDTVRQRVPDLEERFLRFALSNGEARRPSGTGVWLLNAWSADPARQQGLVRFLRGRAPEARPLDGGLSEGYWHTVGQHPDLVTYAAFGDLLTETSWTVARQDVAFQRRDSGDGVHSTRLARACYDARRVGLAVEEIMQALAEAGAASIPPEHVDGMLREFQGLLFHLASPEDLVNERQAAEKDLFECYRLLTDGDGPIFGPDFAERFADYLDQRMADDIKIRQELRKELAARRRSRGRGTPRKSMVSRMLPGSQSKAPAQQDSGPPQSAQPGEAPVADGTPGDRWEGSRAHRP